MKSHESIRVLVADDHHVVRAGLRVLLAAQHDIEIVAEAASGPEAVRKVRRCKADVVLLDVSMPDTIATECIREILQRRPEAAVVILTMHDDPLYVRETMRAGATRYLMKSTSPASLVEAIRSARTSARGNPDPTRGVGESLGESERDDESERDAPSVDGSASGLSQREAQVLAALARGLTYQEIAGELGVSISSIGTYRSRIAIKLGIESRADLVDAAARLRLVGRTG